MKFMITNNGTHPPQKWADLVTDEVTALIKVDGNSPAATEGLVQKREFGARVLKIMLDIFEDSKKHCQKLDDSRFNEMVTQTIADIAKAAQGTVFSQHFLRDETVLYLRDLLSRRCATAIQEYRNWRSAAPPSVTERANGHHDRSHDQR